ncbi:MAG: pyrrolysine--tRNA(Pyl) ligase large subunit [Deltaproteobacteria bacterium]|nr:pyrrolysine--tRNA(Pyl) ligase large subunit [Deltaproteobacteria bacterium]
MNDLTWTNTQARRLKELGVGLDDFPGFFSTLGERDKLFQKIEKKKVRKERARLKKFLVKGGKTSLESLVDDISLALCKHGFTRVATPVIISMSALAKMTVDKDNPLFHQVYKINEKQCLRPMLAPSLYSLMVDFCRVDHRPIRFFEIGSCFRKESDGARHNKEFTMLNLVEMGTAPEKRYERLEELSRLIVKTAGINDFRFEKEDSRVYGTTLDVVSGKESLELASGAMGPHPLDAAWGITDTWVGIGFGIERLLMASKGDTSIGRWAKSLSYLDGMRLSI